MGRLLYDLHQSCDQRWKWHGAFPGYDYLIVSRRSWAMRAEAEAALTCFLKLLGHG